jgi:hypothetical protein
MADEIGLQELLLKVKEELLAPVGEDPAPLFYVEQVDLELSVVIRKAAQAGVRVYVVDVGGNLAQESANKVRVSLRPLYSREEMRAMLEKDATVASHLAEMAGRGAVKGLFES